MKAIQVRYLAATDTKPARLKAFGENGAGYVIIDVDSDRDIEVQEIAVAQKYIAFMGWEGCVLGGSGIIGNKDRVFVLAAVGG